MKKLLTIPVVLALLSLCGCTKWGGEPVTKDFDIEGNYTKLTVEDAFDITVSDAATKAIVTANERDMPKIIVEESGDELCMYLKGWSLGHGKIQVILPYNPELKSVNLSGASDFTSDFVFTGQRVEVSLSGASDFNGRVETEELKLTLSGSSEATVKGQTGILGLELSGSSDLVRKTDGNRYALWCDKCECAISGSSDAFIHCDGEITGSISGSSRLHFTGNAFTADCDVSGSSDLIHDVLQ